MQLRWVFFVAIACSHFLAGCASNFSSERTGLHSSNKSFDAFVVSQMEKQRIPGLSLAVVKNGRVVFAKGYGTANLELNVPASPETVYALGSVSKQFTAAAILMLAQDGKLDLDASVTNYLRDLPREWDGVTLRHLLTHTSGIKDEEWKGGRADFSHGEWSQEEVIKTAFGPLDSPPGEKWVYNNAGYRLLGMIIEKVSGKSYWDFLQSKIFGPLQMNSTRNSDPKVIIHNRAQGYVPSGDKYLIREAVTPSAAFSEGALVSTVLDLAKWDAALYGESILKKASFDKMTTRAIKIPRYNCYYGFGWFLYDAYGHRMMDHTGAILGFGAYIGRGIDDGITVIVLANSEDADCTPIAKKVTGLYVAALARRK